MRRIIQVSITATEHAGANCENVNYVLAALCDDGTVFIASATTSWSEMPPIPQTGHPSESKGPDRESD